MIYRTRKKKRITVFFSKNENDWLNNRTGWISRSDLQKLFDVPANEIETVKTLITDTNETHPELYSLDFILKIGNAVNPKEAADLKGWFERMTEQHDDIIFEEIMLNIVNN